MKKSKPAGSSLAYSYVRFSTPEQRLGDSLRRQTEATAAWCQRNGVRLDTSLTLRDLGVSAFKGRHRQNPDKHALAAFLKLVEQGRVSRGSYLVIENLDRLSREDERTALRLWMDILDAGVNIVQLIPETVFRHDKCDMIDIMRAIIELGRGHSESRAKSTRVDAAWRQRLERTRRGEVVLTRALPAWVTVQGDKVVAIPERVTAIHRIFTLAAAGYGPVRITQALTAEKVPPFGGREVYTDTNGDQRLRAAGGGRYGSGRWQPPYVRKLLDDRRLLGEFQPLKADGTPDGDLLPNYFPRVITPEQWDVARRGVERRRAASGARANDTTAHVNLFATLVRDARDGGPMCYQTRTAAGRHSRILLPARSREGTVSAMTFPALTFEAALLAKLQELDPATVMGEDTAPAELTNLGLELDQVRAELAEVAAYLDAHGFSLTLGQRVTTLEGRKAELTERLAEARQRAASPLAAAWDDTKSLAGILEHAAKPEDVRVRIRTALRRIIDEVYLLAVPRGLDRLAAVQICFAGGKRRRDYVIYHRHSRRGYRERIPARWRAWSLAEVVKSDDLDLRHQEDVAALEKELAALDLAGLTAGGPQGGEGKAE
jgi:DNA invertase Pin-like site-specific DNA recombinase